MAHYAAFKKTWQLNQCTLISGYIHFKIQQAPEWYNRTLFRVMPRCARFHDSILIHHLIAEMGHSGLKAWKQHLMSFNHVPRLLF